MKKKDAPTDPGGSLLKAFFYSIGIDVTFIDCTIYEDEPIDIDTIDCTPEDNDGNSN